MSTGVSMTAADRDDPAVSADAPAQEASDAPEVSDPDAPSSAGRSVDLADRDADFAELFARERQPMVRVAFLPSLSWTANR